MRIDVSRVLADFDGGPVIDDKGKAWELRDMILAALNHAPKGLSPAESVERYKAMRAVSLEDQPELAVELLAIIKEGLARCFVPRLAGQAILMIEGH